MKPSETDGSPVVLNKFLKFLVAGTLSVNVSAPCRQNGFRGRWQTEFRKILCPVTQIFENLVGRKSKTRQNFESITETTQVAG